MEQLRLCNIDNVAAASALVDTADSLYFEAGWRLKPPNPGAWGAGIPIPEPESSLSSRPRPPARPSSYLSTPPRKRKQDQSSSPTSQPSKRANSALHSFSSAISESRTSISRDLSEYVWCELCKKSYHRYMRDYDMHFPHFFWVCIGDRCEFYANRLDGITGQHWGRKDHEEFLRGRDRKELEERQRRNKFVIPDAGHQNCVYCDEDFDDTKNYVYRRDHHARHVRDEDQDALG